MTSFILATATCLAEEEYTNPRSKEACLAYRASPSSQLSMDYFARFSRDPHAAPSEKEMVIGKAQRILPPADAKPLTELMAGHLMDFLNQRMALNVSIEKRSRDGLAGNSEKTITLLASGVGDTSPPREFFSLAVESRKTLIQGKESSNLRNGIVKLVSIIGLKQTPILELGQQVYKPRVPLHGGRRTPG